MRSSVIQGQLEEISNAGDLDESLRDILISLNKTGYCTSGSCSGYEYEHTGRRKSCNFGPFVSIMARNWEAKKVASELRRDLLGTYWNVNFHSFPYMLIRGDRKQIISYSHNAFYKEEYDLQYSIIFLVYKKNLSDKQIKRGWNILLSRLVGD